MTRTAGGGIATILLFSGAVVAGVSSAFAQMPLTLEEAMKRASNDDIAAARAAYHERPHPRFRTNGPRTRREFLRLRALHGAGPA